MKPKPALWQEILSALKYKRAVRLREHIVARVAPISFEAGELLSIAYSSKYSGKEMSDEVKTRLRNKALDIAADCIRIIESLDKPEKVEVEAQLFIDEPEEPKFIDLE